MTDACPPRSASTPLLLRVGAAILACVLALALAACGGGSGATVATITAQPADQSVVVGTAPSFQVTASNATGYQWQRSTDGGSTFVDVGGATAATHTAAPAVAADNGTRYRVVVQGSGGSVTSSAAVLTVTGAAVGPAISVAPADRSVVEGQDASFAVTATGTSPAYQWQRSTDGGASFTDIAGASSATLTVPAVGLAANGTRFRVRVSNSVGSVDSRAAVLTVTAARAAPAFGTQPASTAVVAPATASFNVVATGTPAPSLQWQVSTDGGASFTDIPGATGTSHTTAATALADNGQRFRVVATNAAGSATSTVATLTVTAAPVAPAFGLQPADATVLEGSNARFTVTVTGTPAPTLQWQLSTDGGVTWTNVVGATANALDLNGVALADSGRRVRAVASNGSGSVNSNAALLTVTPAAAFPLGARAFSADDGATGGEFWMTDGTAAGTVLVKDINPGLAGSAPSFITRFGRFMIFAADDGTHGRELWRSDGTAAGTAMVADLRPGLPSSFPNRFKECNGSLFFGANGGSGDALWKTDGTAAGTVKVADLAVMNTTRPMACLNNLLILSASNAASGSELWRSDGTAAGTTLVKDIVAGAGGSDPRELVLFLGKVFFSTGADGLWSSDGTAAGTVQVATGMGEPTWLTVNGSTLYFSGVNAAFGSEPWKSDGTTAGTGPIADLNTTPAAFGGGTVSSFPYKFTVSGGVTYFGAEPVTNSQQLWRTDGTAAGTFALTSLAPGRVASFGDSILDVGGTLYFLAAGGGLGQELWKTDGTVAGTVLVKDIAAGALDSLPTGFMSIGNVLLFSAGDGVNGTELWRSDGTAAGTQLLKDICSPGCSGSPQP